MILSRAEDFFFFVFWKYTEKNILIQINSRFYDYHIEIQRANMKQWKWEEISLKIKDEIYSN